MTRRDVVLAAPAALLAQTTAAQQPPPIPANPEEELKAAHDQQRLFADQLAKTPLPMTTEPACHFKP